MIRPEPAIKSISIKNLLSFGDQPQKIEFNRLNILIGPNGSGKSNLIEIMGLLQSAPKDLSEPIRIGGGVQEWLWKGAKGRTSPIGSIDLLVNHQRYPTAQLPRATRVPGKEMSLRYSLSIAKSGDSFEIMDERIENERPFPGQERPYFYYGYEQGKPVLNVKKKPRYLRREELNPQQSVLSQRKDPDQYPEVTYIGQLFASFRLYRDWEIGVNTLARESCATDAPKSFLEEDASNLALIISTLLNDLSVKRALLHHLKLFYKHAEDILMDVSPGKLALFIEESSGFKTPAVRLSDGTLRWIFLLAVLLHPNAPPLVCIEEPELGLHPDMIGPLAELLRIASERMQLIVSTHSSALIDAFTDTPENVIVFEKDGASTTMKHLDRVALASWLEEYSLGELWRKGEIGGNRW